MFRNTLRLPTIVQALRRKFSRDTHPNIYKRNEQFLDILLNDIASSGVRDDGSIIFEKMYDNKVGLMTINNPNRKGAISSRMMLKLADIAYDHEIKSELSCLIIRGIGKSFCSGLDLNLAKRVINTPNLGALMSSFMTDCFNTIRNSEVISVCLLAGPAIGGGSEIATVGDFRLMSRDSCVQFVHAKIGASPGWGGASRAYDIMGRSQALRALGSSKIITPEEALRIGMCDEIIDLPTDMQGADRDEALLKRTIVFLEQFLLQPYPQSVKGIKSILSKNCKQEMEETERKVFYKRWFCEDNLHALKIKNK